MDPNYQLAQVPTGSGATGPIFGVALIVLFTRRRVAGKHARDAVCVKRFQAEPFNRIYREEAI